MRKLQVFVSSTYSDLREERQAAVQAILASGHIPAGMELFAAGSESQMQVIRRWIDDSDVFMLILGGCYGSIEPRSGKSYTHLEYEYALSANKPLFAIVLTESHQEDRIRAMGSAVGPGDYAKELRGFREFVLRRISRFWGDTKDIKLAVYESLNELSQRSDLVGWVRGDQTGGSPEMAEQFARLVEENRELRRQRDEIDPSKDVLPPDRIDRLAQMLIDMFSVPEMTRLVQRLPSGLELVRTLPSETTTQAEYAYKAAEALRRFGLIDKAFFGLVSDFRPARVGDVTKVAHAFGIEV